MSVSELIEFLKTQPQHLPVVYKCCSEYDTLTADQIEVKDLCRERPDGWVHCNRPDMPTQAYLVLPGN